MGLELDSIFHPRSIAVAGASAEPGKQGHTYFRVLKENGFQGPVYPVNPRGGDVLGVPAYPTVAAIPDEVDYVISTVPAAAVPQLVDDCAAKGVKLLHLFTGRFGETGHADAAAMEQEILQRARRAGIRIIGPNCMGLYYPREGIGFKLLFPQEPGSVAVLSQSGGNAADIVLSGALRGLRYSKVLSYGNALDLNESDFLEYLADDPETSVIGLYLEGVKDGPRFFRALRRAASVKPVVLLKSGRTQAGVRAVASHTASLAGSDRVWDALCRQAGAVSAANVEDLVDMLTAFTFLPPVSGLRVAVGGGGGGRSVQSADACEEAGLLVGSLPDDIRATLRERDPQYWDWIDNPVDGSILGGSPWGMDEILSLLARSPDYDLMIANIDEFWSLDEEQGARQLLRQMDGFERLRSENAKPLALVVGDSIQAHDWQTETLETLRQRGADASLALFPTVTRAALSLRRLVDYYRRRNEEEVED